MKTGSWKVFFAILAATIVIAWVTGMLIVRDILPRWAMIVVNPPFGAVYAWTESLWAMGKGNYYLNGQIISDGQIGTIQSLAESRPGHLILRSLVAVEAGKAKAGVSHRFLNIIHLESKENGEKVLGYNHRLI